MDSNTDDGLFSVFGLQPTYLTSSSTVVSGVNYSEPVASTSTDVPLAFNVPLSIEIPLSSDFSSVLDVSTSNLNNDTILNVENPNYVTNIPNCSHSDVLPDLNEFSQFDFDAFLNDFVIPNHMDTSFDMSGQNINQIAEELERSYVAPVIDVDPVFQSDIEFNMDLFENVGDVNVPVDTANVVLPSFEEFISDGTDFTNL